MVNDRPKGISDIEWSRMCGAMPVKTHKTMALMMYLSVFIFIAFVTGAFFLAKYLYLLSKMYIW